MAKTELYKLNSFKVEYLQVLASTSTKFHVKHEERIKFLKQAETILDGFIDYLRIHRNELERFT